MNAKRDKKITKTLKNTLNMQNNTQKNKNKRLTLVLVHVSMKRCFNSLVSRH